MSALTPNSDFLSEQQPAKVIPINAEAEEKERQKKLYEEKYSVYLSLTEYQRKCLVATNYHRVLQGLDYIEVPPEDTNYYKSFDKGCFQRRKEIVAHQKRIEEKLSKENERKTQIS